MFFVLSIVAIFVSCGLFSCRRKSWYFLLWLPITLLNLSGSVVFLSCIALLQKISGHGGEDTGFVGLGALLRHEQRLELFIIRQRHKSNAGHLSWLSGRNQ